jgi:uncharacterized surface protein with fasciclin (FAS1) repeats
MRRLVFPLVAGLLVTTSLAGPVSAAPRAANIVQTALAVNAQTGEFDHLIAAVVRTGLADALSQNRQITVFAPTDAAFETLFATLGVSGVEEIPVAVLSSVLLYHVAPGERFSGSVIASDRIRTLAKAFLRPSTQAGAAYVNDARIVLADVDASNGVIHVIDGVLVP